MFGKTSLHIFNENDVTFALTSTKFNVALGLQLEMFSQYVGNRWKYINKIFQVGRCRRTGIQRYIPSVKLPHGSSSPTLSYWVRSFYFHPLIELRGSFGHQIAQNFQALEDQLKNCPRVKLEKMICHWKNLPPSPSPLTHFTLVYFHKHTGIHHSWLTVQYCNKNKKV